MLLLVVTLSCTIEYGFGSDPVGGSGGSSDTGVQLAGDGDTDGSDSHTGDGTVGDDPTIDTDGGGGETDTPDIPTADDCTRAVELDGWLDQFQVQGDDRVLFCHSGSGGHYSMVEANIDSCLKHLRHPGDVFPTLLCDS